MRDEPVDAEPILELLPPDAATLSALEAIHDERVREHVHEMW
jgi:hypothetical protein